MREDRFEWHDAKAASNYRKHGVSFEAARAVFDDENHIEDFEDEADGGEERWVRIGMAEGRLLAVVYTERGARIRIISAREASRHEQDRYFRERS